MKNRILFICIHNSARSQIAEGLVNALYADRFEALSGGTAPTRVHPGRDQGHGRDRHRYQRPSLQEHRRVRGRRFDYVVMVCDDKQADCPFFPGGKEYIHHAFDDPAACAGTDEEVLACFRKTRDEIKKWIEETLVKPE